MAGRAWTVAGQVPISPGRLRLLGSFALEIDGRPVETPPAGQRVLALVTLFGGAAPRSRVAGTLWPEQSEGRALSNLRAAVWRMPDSTRCLLIRRGATLATADALRVDLDEAGDLARDLLDAGASLDPAGVDRDLLMRDLLPGLDDEWLVVPRERHRQLRLHALEALAMADLQHYRALDAVDVALAAVDAEPLRESAQLLLISAHLAAGNRAAALDQFGRFRRLLASELDVAPSAEMTELVSHACGPTVTAQ